MEQSIRNEIPGTVKEIISDKVLSEIIVETAVGAPELKLAHAGRVDHERAGGRLHEFAPRRRVTALAIPDAERIRLQVQLWMDRVQQR